MSEKTILCLALVAVLLVALFGASMAVLGAAVQADRMARLQGNPIAAPFTDVQGHWAESYIEQIRLAGLTAGCSTEPSMFCPDKPLTRAEAAVFMARLLDLGR
jgi:hypothetical protein